MRNNLRTNTLDFNIMHDANDLKRLYLRALAADLGINLTANTQQELLDTSERKEPLEMAWFSTGKTGPGRLCRGYVPA